LTVPDPPVVNWHRFPAQLSAPLDTVISTGAQTRGLPLPSTQQVGLMLCAEITTGASAMTSSARMPRSAGTGELAVSRWSNFLIICFNRLFICSSLQKQKAAKPDRVAFA
jgi:hypothetical protein